MKICFYCNEEILPEQSRFLLGIEIPYANVWLHREHYKLIEPILREYLTENYDRLLKVIERKTK